MKVNPATADALVKAAEVLRYRNKEAEIKRIEENLRQEKLRVKKLRTAEPGKGTSVDVSV